MRLSREEALFAARRLHEEESTAFEPAGPVRSNAQGITRAESLLGDVHAKVQPRVTTIPSRITRGADELRCVVEGARDLPHARRAHLAPAAPRAS